MSNKSPMVSAIISQGAGGFRCELTLKLAKTPHYLISLEIPRRWAEEVGLGPPSAFVAQPLPPDGLDPKWAHAWNRKNLRLVGCMELEPNRSARLFFPARLPLVPDLEINGQFTSSRNAGSPVAFFRASFGEFGRPA